MRSGQTRSAGGATIVITMATFLLLIPIIIIDVVSKYVLDWFLVQMLACELYIKRTMNKRFYYYGHKSVSVYPRVARLMWGKTH